MNNPETVKDWEKRFEEKFNNTFWAEVATEASLGDVDHKPFLSFIQEEFLIQRKEIERKIAQKNL